MRQAPNDIPQEIINNPLYYPYFKDYIGMIDGTHVDAMLPINLVARFLGRKGVTHNVLAACTPNKLFIYVLVGWEGSANDYRILQDALSRPQPRGLRVYDGKYYLCDAGYPTMLGFISPYRGVRYHLKEHSSKTPKNRRELFNLRHSSLSSKIESAFGTLKNRFKILCAKPHYPFPIQVDIVLACMILHNFIVTVDPSGELVNDDEFNEDIDGEVAFENDTNLVDQR
ncbi:protein ALP1-like [Asparagus officinalis]|uniref:protein ALP1-like n=1 Tax=Asparagus officinalis TaxID=4686 RepID=UPI00098DFAE4|nr:protein ALP1-like [Asparagus officinalis]